MASSSYPEKTGLVDPYSPSAPESRKSSLFLPFAPFSNIYNRFSQWRTDLGLPNPGTVENLQKEVKSSQQCLPCLLKR
jgi:mitochondrial import receptor subunit TOM40